MRKGENAGNQHFLLFPQYFLLYQREKSSFMLSSANALNSDQSYNLSLCKELMHLKDPWYQGSQRFFFSTPKLTLYQTTKYFGHWTNLKAFADNKLIIT